MDSKVEKKMRAVIYTAPGEYSYSEDTQPIPVPQRGQVLIRVEYSVINPTDIYLLKGLYKHPMIKFGYPYTPGFEGSGIVVGYGGGLLGWSLQGKRVAFGKPNEELGSFTRPGAYGEYCVTEAFNCIPLPNNISLE